MFSLKGRFCGLVTRFIVKWRNLGRRQRAAPNLFESRIEVPGEDDHISANNYRRGNSSAPWREEVRVHRSARREKTIAATATIGNFFGHRSSPRPTVIGRADGVAAGMRRADWPGTRVRKSLAADFNACRMG